jgi:flavodoxin
VKWFPPSSNHKGDSMRIGIIYYTKLGHSRKIAQAISQELKIEAQDIRTHPNLDGIDLLYIVSGIYGGKSDPELLKFLSTLDNQQVKKAVLLTSSGGKTIKAVEVRASLSNLDIDVLQEEFTCQGAIFFIGIGHPNKTDLQNAVAFVQQTSQQKMQN